jgi:hypothetical protein
MKITKAELLPLDGKYYGTKIKLVLDKASDIELKIWIHDGEPSVRELKDNNDEDCEFDSSHYETAGDLEVAETIVTAINKYMEYLNDITRSLAKLKR